MSRPPRETPTPSSLVRLDRATTVPIRDAAAAGAVPVTGATTSAASTAGPCMMDLSNVAIDAALRDALRKDLALPPPLMMLPMRLEYRVVDANRRRSRCRTAWHRCSERCRRRTKQDERPGRLRLRANTPTRRERRPTRKWTLDSIAAHLQDATGDLVPLVSRRQLHAARRARRRRTPRPRRSSASTAASGGKAWTAHRRSRQCVSAWQALSREIAPERALYPPAQSGAAAILSISTALGHDDDAARERSCCSRWARGRRVRNWDAARAIDPAAALLGRGLQADGWLADFDAAIEAGMGLRLTDQDGGRAALAADWIIAVGLSQRGWRGATDRPSSRIAIANGEFAFLPQDTATNNAPGQPIALQDAACRPLAPSCGRGRRRKRRAVLAAHAVGGALRRGGRHRRRIGGPRAGKRRPRTTRMPARCYGSSAPR